MMKLVLKQGVRFSGVSFNAVSLLLVLLLISLSTQAESVTRLIWKNQPLLVSLKPGEDVRVIFPANVTIQVPVPLLDKLNTLQVNPRVVYWKALESFPASQIIAISDEADEVYLINLAAHDQGLSNPITIDDPAWVLRQQPTQQSTPKNEAPTLNDPAEVVLVRHVAQTLYAPLRLMPTHRGIQRVPVEPLPERFRLKRSQRGESYRYEVIGQWRGFDRYVTAVKIENQSPLTLDVIDLRTVRGNFTHIATQHPSLGPSGQSEAVTTLYLVSLVPFREAVEGSSYGF